MTWKLTDWGKTRSGVPGVPWRDLTNKEFRDAEKLFEKGELKAQGYFEKVVETEEEDDEEATTTFAVEPLEMQDEETTEADFGHANDATGPLPAEEE